MKYIIIYYVLICLYAFIVLTSYWIALTCGYGLFKIEKSWHLNELSTPEKKMYITK